MQQTVVTMNMAMSCIVCHIEQHIKNGARESKKIWL